MRRLNCEIISVDSAQVYRDMNIGTAKPDAALLATAPHHLINLINPDEAYSAARFRDDALVLMREITARGNIPLLTGGTMMYFKALTEGLSELPEADPMIRMIIDTMAEEKGWPGVHNESSARWRFTTSLTKRCRNCNKSPSTFTFRIVHSKSASCPPTDQSCICALPNASKRCSNWA